MIYPISEIFTSPQGEGVFTGQIQTFIRLAGCSVGKPFTKEDRKKRLLPIYVEQCTLYDGRHMECDTDYRVKDRLTVPQILNEIPELVENVCITGGEPLIHDLNTLITYLWAARKKVHIETSGTVEENLDETIWVTVSPKLNVYVSMLKRANEIKVLVDEEFDPSVPIHGIYQELLQVVTLEEIAKKKPVYLQPVNHELEVNPDNLQRCVDWQKKYPQFRLSLQLHKVLSHFTRELVR